jgi:hypothetical protein
MDVAVTGNQSVWGVHGAAALTSRGASYERVESGWTISSVPESASATAAEASARIHTRSPPFT